MTRPGEWPAPPEPLPGPIVDNHCHLEYPAGDEPRTVADRLAEAAAVGVTRAVQVGHDVESSQWTAKAVEEFPELLGAVALHPNEAPVLAQAGKYEESFAQIAALARGERIRAVGETGLDFFRTGPDGRDAQIASFRDHIALAKELNKPLQIHDRDAHAEIIDILDKDGAPERTVFHCFSGDSEMARLCAQRGWYVSVAGTVTFKNAGGLRAAVEVTPLSQILIETDSPFLTPHPHRGKPNAPAQAALTVRAVAAVLEQDLEDVCSAVWNTSHSIYGPW